MAHILIVEDDPLIIGPMQRALETNGYTVLTATDGQAGLELALSAKPDLVILDVMLPRLNGWDACQAIRTRSTVPILMVTALGEEVDRILGLELGADDYITKPFSMRELAVRIKATLRRVEFDTRSQATGAVITIQGVSLHFDNRKVFKNGQELPLRYKEFELLSLLMLNAGNVVTRAEIFDKVWGTDWLGDMRTLDVHIRWLREKLEADPSNPDLIQTVRGVGYRFITK